MLASASCLNLQKTHTVRVYVLLLSWKSKGRTRLADFICSVDIKNWLLGDFFLGVLCYKIPDRFCSKTSWGFLLGLFDWEMFLEAWEHNHCMLDMSVCLLKHYLGESLAQHRIRGSSGSVKHPNLIPFYFSPLFTLPPLQGLLKLYYLTKTSKFNISKLYLECSVGVFVIIKHNASQICGQNLSTFSKFNGQ